MHAEERAISLVRNKLTDSAVLVVSHRFAAVRAADRIVVMSAGRVAEEGTHDELAAAGGIYAELIRVEGEAWPRSAPAAGSV